MQDFLVQYDSNSYMLYHLVPVPLNMKTHTGSRNVLIAVTDVPKPAGTKGANLQGVLPGEGKGQCDPLVATLCPAVAEGLS